MKDQIPDVRTGNNHRPLKPKQQGFELMAKVHSECWSGEVTIFPKKEFTGKQTLSRELSPIDESESPTEFIDTQIQ